MSVSRTPLARAALAALGVLTALMFSGCPWWSHVRPPQLSAESPPATEPPSHEAAGKSSPGTPAGGPKAADDHGAAAAGPTGDAASDLAGETWIRAVPAPGEKSALEFRWRSPPLDDLLADLSEPEPVLRDLVDHDNRLVAANAAIALGRLGDAATADRLAAIVDNRKLKLSTRCAAAEALGRLAEPEALAGLRKLADRYQYTPKNRTRYIAEIHAELVRGLARHADPVDQEHLVAALHSPSPEVQWEALAAWEGDRPGSLPKEAVDLRTAQDVRVRAAALHVLARRRHPQAAEYLTGALHDCDVRARISAIGGLGELGDENSRTTLKGLLSDRAELVRAAVVSALAAAGDRQTVLECAGDKSWRVRLVVAEALVRYPDREGVAVAVQLLDDPSTALGPQVLKSISRWPLERAGPILLEAMAKQGYLVRKEAAAQLAARWAPASEFSHEAPPERRREVLDKLTARFRQEIGLIDAAALAKSAKPSAGGPATPLTPEQIDEVTDLLGQLSNPGVPQQLRQEAIGRLTKLGPALIPVLEQFAVLRKQPLPEVVYREVLPKCAPVFDSLDRLALQDVTMRRRAAAELVELSGREALGRLAVERLASLAAGESDPLVWRSVLLTVAADGSEPSTRLAIAAIGHPSAEVRRRACEHLAAHPDVRHAKVLLAALEDPSDPVVLAAVRALAAGERPDGLGRLERLLAHDNQSVQLEAARALSKFGSPAGTAALERLAHSGDPNIRREVAAAMGQLGDPVFTPTLIRMLDDGHGIPRTALDALTKIVGRDVAGAGTSLGQSERADKWKQWYQQQHQTSLSRRPDDR